MTNTNYISIYNLRLINYTVSGEVNAIQYTDALTFKQYCISLIEYSFYQTATLSDMNGVTYVINVLNVKEILINNYDTLEIIFENEDALYVKYDDAVRLNAEKKYIEFIIECNSFEKIYKNTNRLIVNPSFSNDGIKKTYSTIESANEASIAGDVIYITAGTYAEVITLRNGRVYYFEEGSVVESIASYTIVSESIPGTGYQFAKVFGRGVFRILSGAFNPVIQTGSDSGAIERDYALTFFIECKELHNPDGRVLLPSESVIKCKWIHNESNTYAIWDTDTGGNYRLINIVDAQYIKTTKAEFSFHQDGTAAIYSVKNAVIQADSASGLVNFGESDMSAIHRFELCMIYNLDQSGGGLAGGVAGYPLVIDLYNCVVQQEAGQYSNYSPTGMQVIYNLYSYNYFTKPAHPTQSVINSFTTRGNYKLIA